MKKRGNNDSDPVLLFDNEPSNSSPIIELLTTAEVSEMLNVSVATVRRLQQGRHIPFIKVGGSVRFAKSDIVSYLEKRRVGNNRLNTHYGSTNGKEVVVD